MATRIEYIMLLARDTLNDHSKERWSDDTLLRFIRLAIQDIAKQTHLFKHITVVPLINGRGTYKLPDGILRLSHCTYNRELLPLVTSGWMTANKEVDWRTKGVVLPGGELEFAIFDEVQRKQLAVYPRPFGNLTEYYTSVPDEYGLVGGIDDYTDLTSYGIVAELIDLDVVEQEQTSYYGVVTLVAEVGSLTIYYTRCPPLPDDINDDLEIDEVFDAAIKFYVCGMALRNDLDLENRQMAGEEFTLYQREIESIIELSHADSVDAAWFESHYNSMG